MSNTEGVGILPAASAGRKINEVTESSHAMPSLNSCRPRATRATKQDADDRMTSKYRKEVGKAMNSEMLISHITPFLKHYGPHPAIAEKSVDECKNYLRSQGLLTEQGWAEYPLPPSETRKKEPEAFEPLKRIINGIQRYAENEKGNSFKFKMVPHNHLDDSIGGSRHKMDACVIEREYEGKLPNNLIVVPWELKTEATERLQRKVREQVVGDCHQILCEDPRRMFIFAVTIEGTRLSVWYFSRSHSVKTFALDWMREGIDDFIRVILAFTYASPKDMGIDSYVHIAPLFEEDEGQQYVYEFKVLNDSARILPPPQGPITRTSAPQTHHPGHSSIYYRTVRARIPMRPTCISGRTTRIWEVVPVASVEAKPKRNAEHHILKDVWLSENFSERTEGEKQDLIFQAIDQFAEKGLKAHPGPNSMMDFIDSEPKLKHFNNCMKSRLAGLLSENQYQNLFLTKLCQWKGEFTKERSTAAKLPQKPLFIRGSAEGKGGKGNWGSEGGPSGTTVLQTQTTSVVLQPAEIASRHQYHQKRQVRFIYKEICTEICNLPTLGDVIDITRQALDALQILYCAGWVHRDISTGNIMAIPRTDKAGKTVGWQVKLSDLEFAQEVGCSTNKTDPLTGTAYFMPVEIMSREHLAMNFYIPDNPKPPELVFPGKACEVNPNTLAAKFNLSTTHPDYVHYSQYDVALADVITFGDSLPTPVTHKPIPVNYVNHNYQHDLEAIWWMILCFITACAGSDESKNYSKKIFTSNFDPSNRHIHLTESIRSKLYRVLHPKLKTTFANLMEELRKHLYLEYLKRAVFGTMETHEAYSFIHTRFAEQLDTILAEDNGKWKELPIPQDSEESTYDWGLTPLSESGPEDNIGSPKPHRVAASRKRGREEDSEIEEDNLRRRLF